MEIILPPYVEIYDKLQDGKNKDCFIQKPLKTCVAMKHRDVGAEAEKKENGGF